ncbi:MAG: ABC transporter [Peptococcaceae bacterium]|nr:ABC transporter [Peptococcaceae bacterium]
MVAVMKREIGAYFQSPVGYVFLAVYYLFAGFYFFTGCLFYRSGDLVPVFNSLFTVQLFLIPMLTMRLMSEERKNKTDQVLLTVPLSLTAMVLGKYFAAALMLVLAEGMVLIYALGVSFFSPLYLPVFVGCFAAILLLGLSLISVGLFISSLTENQVISAIGGYGASLFFLLIDSLRAVFTNPVAERLISSVSFFNRYQSFSIGIFNYANILYFLSVSTVFIFLTIRVFEKRRWG